MCALCIVYFIYDVVACCCSRVVGSVVDIFISDCPIGYDTDG